MPIFLVTPDLQIKVMFILLSFEKSSTEVDEVRTKVDEIKIRLKSESH